ncbi:MFS family permease [Marisediminicola sp. UYEF4]|uniref:MFS transporter n=1 Tax=Marisediminicola sp. UYEF4 TaxID=1756384 RepID=UPI003390AE82
MTAVTDLVALQRRTVRVLVAGQILGGIGIGSTLAIGAVLAAQISGSDAWSGSAATLSTLGAAAAAIPLARLAQRLGRRPALATGVLASAAGAVITVIAAAFESFPLLLIGFGLLGVGTAVNLQSRFAATDVASPERRGRDLSLVVWSTTIGAVLGPNLFGPGELVADAFGMPPLTGSFAIAVLAQVAAAVVYLTGLRPDPYLVSRDVQRAQDHADSAAAELNGPAEPHTPSEAQALASAAARSRTLLVFAIGAIAISHAVMVSVMSMTPVHLTNMGSSLTIVGLTISLHIAGMYALSPLFGWLSDRGGRIRTILIGQAMFIVALVAVAVGAESPTLVTMGLIFLGLGWSAATVSGSALVADLVTGPARARIQGRTDLIMSLSGAGGGALAGPVLALIGYSGLAWAAGVLVLSVIVGAGLVARVPTQKVAVDQLAE